MGRPTLLDDTIAHRICAALAAGNTRSTAARAAGIGWSTLKTWLARGRHGEEPFAAFLAQVKKAEADGEAELVATIRAGATRTWQCAAWLLERRFPRRWARRDLPEPKSVEKLSDEELRQELTRAVLQSFDTYAGVREAVIAKVDAHRRGDA